MEAEVTERATVLVVERSDEARRRVGSWLEEEGFEILACPGPTEPPYRCLGARRGTCPLVHGADLVVLDLWLDSDKMMEGSSGVDLVSYYLSSGLPVVALTYGSEPDQLICEEDIATLAGPIDRREIVETVRTLLANARS